MNEQDQSADVISRPSMTLRQIEVVRAIMITGTIAGAAKLLRVSAPGISRLMKYTERSLKVRLFERRHGRYAPTPEAQDIFEQINGVYKKVDDLQYTLSRIERGGSVELQIGSVPSISYVMVPRAIARLRRLHPELRFDINILKIEEAIDYILLGKGELVVMSYKLDHPGIDFLPLAQGKLVCIVPDGHELAGRASVSAADMARHPLIGIEPTDPYGRIMVELFTRENLNPEMIIKARFGMTVAALVKAGLGIAIIDEFTVAHGAFSGIKVLPISEPTVFQAHIAVRADRALSRYAENLIQLLRVEMTAVASGLANT
jgi:DNA-binding transcriptional LysR family regulator